MSTRRRRPGGNPGRVTTVEPGPYDQAAMLAQLRARRAEAGGELHDALEGLARRLAKEMFGSLPDIPPATIGAVLLCATSYIGGMHHRAGVEFGTELPWPVAVNVVAMAADNLIGGAGETS